MSKIKKTLTEKTLHCDLSVDVYDDVIMDALCELGATNIRISGVIQGELLNEIGSRFTMIDIGNRLGDLMTAATFCDINGEPFEHSAYYGLPISREIKTFLAENAVIERASIITSSDDVYENNKAELCAFLFTEYDMPVTADVDIGTAEDKDAAGTTVVLTVIMDKASTNQLQTMLDAIKNKTEARNKNGVNNRPK